MEFILGNFSFILNYLYNSNIYILSFFFLYFIFFSYKISKEDIKSKTIPEKPMWFLIGGSYLFISFLLKEYITIGNFMFNGFILIFLSFMTTQIIIPYNSRKRPFIEYTTMILLIIIFFILINLNFSFYSFLIFTGISLNYIVYSLLSFLSNGNALGGGDRDIGILSGLLFGPLSFIILFLAAFLAVLKDLIFRSNKIIPFGPYLFSGIILIYITIYILPLILN